MSNSIVLTKEGVTVQKELVREGLPMPAVRFSIDSDRGERVAVRLTDTLPDGVTVDDVGFHEDYEKESWHSDGGRRLAFERVIPAGDRVITVYFVPEDDLDIEGFETPPAIEGVQPIDEAEAEEIEAPLFRGGGSDESPVAESTAISDDGGDPNIPDPGQEGVPTGGDSPATPRTVEGSEAPFGLERSADSSTGSGTVDSLQTSPVREPTNGRSTTDDHASIPDEKAIEGRIEAAVDSRMDRFEAEIASAIDERLIDRLGTDADLEAHIEAIADDKLGTRLESESAYSQTGSAERPIAERLLEEIRTDQADDIRESLVTELNDDVPNSVQARIERIETELNELTAYTDALREFIDAEGTGREILADFEDRIASLDETTDAIEASTANLAERLQAVEARQESLDSLATDLDSLESRVEEQDVRLSEQDATVDRLSARTDRIADDVADLEDAVGTMESQLETVDAQFEAVGEILRSPPEESPLDRDR